MVLFNDFFCDLLILRDLWTKMMKSLMFSVSFVKWLVGYDLFWMREKFQVWLG